MSEKQLLSAIKHAKSEGTTNFRVELYDRSNDMYANPTSHIDVWGGGDILYKSKRRSQLYYVEDKANGEYYLGKVFDTVTATSENGDVHYGRGYSCEYVCSDEVKS